MNARRLLPWLSCFALAFVPACDSGKKEDSAKKGGAKAGKDKKGKGAKGKGAKDKGAKDKGDPKAQPKDPHAGLNLGAAPSKSHLPKQPKEPGPARDVTPSGETVDASVPVLALKVPKEWEEVQPTSSMRKAQWVLPGPGGDAELAVFHFGIGGGGSVEDNINRWKGQFQPPEGKTLDDVSKQEEIEGADGFKTTFLQVEGTFVAAVRPGAPEKHNKDDHAMLGAVVVGPGGPYFFKGLGPKKTLDLWTEPYRAMIASFAQSGGRPKSAGTDGAAKPGDAKGADAKPADAKPADGKAADAKADGKAADAKADGAAPAK